MSHTAQVASLEASGGLQLDRLDRRIIDALRRDPRVTNRALGRELGVAQSTVGARVRQLRDGRVLRVVAAVDVCAAGYDLYVSVGVRVNGRLLDRVLSELVLIPEVISLYRVGGMFDVSARLVARDRHQLRELLEHRIGGITGVEHLECDIALGVLAYGPDLASTTRIPLLELPILGIDALDRAIVDTLHNDVRTPLSHIARDGGVSDGTIRLRIERLEKRGLLRFMALSDPEALGKHCVSWVGIQVSPARLSGVASMIARLEEIWHLTFALGRNNLLSIVAVEDREALARFLKDVLLQVPGVERTEPAEILSVLKHDDRWTLTPDVLAP